MSMRPLALPASSTPARAALAILRDLRDAGHAALLAGGCVRDLLLGGDPQDYDVATDAPPDRVCELFQATRRVGAQFGVVLVRRHRVWVEVATFRQDGPYLDGRRPSTVQLSDARHDALRRDFTINGMFLDPLAGQVHDYVGGEADLQAHRVRAIGDPVQRFGEDYLRMLRAVRFTARLQFTLDPATRQAIHDHAHHLPQVAGERIREELDKMLRHPTRAAAWRLLAETGLLPHLWPAAARLADQWSATVDRLAGLPEAASFVAALAAVLADHTPADVHRIAPDLTLSNEQRDAVAWLLENQAALDDPAALSLAQLKRLMAGPAFDALCQLTRIRYAARPDSDARWAALQARLQAIPRDAVQPPPLVTGDDLKQRGVPAGPIYSRLLSDLYTRQLNEELTSREAALQALDAALEAEQE